MDLTFSNFQAVTNDVRESIDHGLAALRGDAGTSGLDLGTGSSVGKPVPGNSSLASSPFFLDLTQQVFLPHLMQEISLKIMNCWLKI